MRRKKRGFAPACLIGLGLSMLIFALLPMKAFVIIIAILFILAGLIMLLSC